MRKFATPPTAKCTQKMVSLNSNNRNYVVRCEPETHLRQQITHMSGSKWLVVNLKIIGFSASFYPSHFGPLGWPNNMSFVLVKVLTKSCQIFQSKHDWVFKSHYWVVLCLVVVHFIQAIRASNKSLQFRNISYWWPPDLKTSQMWSFGHTRLIVDPKLILGIRVTKPSWPSTVPPSLFSPIKRFSESDTKDQVRIRIRWKLVVCGWSLTVPEETRCCDEPLCKK